MFEPFFRSFALRLGSACLAAVDVHSLVPLGFRRRDRKEHGPRKRTGSADIRLSDRFQSYLLTFRKH